MKNIFFVTILLLCQTGLSKELGKVSVQQAQNSAAIPDLSFNGLNFVIPPMDEEFPADGCEDLVSDIIYYKTLEVRSRNYFIRYFSGVQKVLDDWYDKLKVYEEKNVSFVEGTFFPMTELIQNINDIVLIMENNSKMVDDFIYEYTENFAQCYDNVEVYDLLSNYSVDFFKTQSEMWQYMLENSKSLNGLYKDFKKMENTGKHFIAKDTFLPLNNLSSDQLGQGGIEEMIQLMQSVYSQYYDVEYENIQKRIEEVVNVQGRKH